MSMYGGQTRGIQYNDRLALEMARRDNMRNRFSRRQNMGYGIQPIEVMGAPLPDKPSAPEQPDVPRQHGEPITGAGVAQKRTAETEKLPDFIHLAAMGNTAQAENVFNSSGQMKIQPGSTKYDQAKNEISAIDAGSGQPITIRREHVERVLGLYKPQAQMTEEDRAQTEKIRAETEYIKSGKKAGITPYQQQQIDFEKQRTDLAVGKQARAIEDEILKNEQIMNALRNTAKQQTGIETTQIRNKDGSISYKGQAGADEAVGQMRTYKARTDKLRKDLAQLKSLSQGQPSQVGVQVPPQVAPAQPRNRGTGTMTMNGQTVNVPRIQGGAGAMWSGDRSVSLDDVRRPKLQTQFNTIEEAQNMNLPIGTEITINGRRAIVE